MFKSNFFLYPDYMNQDPPRKMSVSATDADKSLEDSDRNASHRIDRYHHPTRKKDLHTMFSHTWLNWRIPPLVFKALEGGSSGVSIDFCQFSLDILGVELQSVPDTTNQVNCHGSRLEDSGLQTDRHRDYDWEVGGKSCQARSKSRFGRFRCLDLPVDAL